ncbi:hypothetical protein PAMP_009708 [Pampus punctatissimus]
MMNSQRCSGRSPEREGEKDMTWNSSQYQGQWRDFGHHAVLLKRSSSDAEMQGRAVRIPRLERERESEKEAQSRLHIL